VGPDVITTLGPDQAGGTFCLHPGDRFSVYLSVPPQNSDNGWSPIRPEDSGVLAPVPSGALTLVRGVTAGIFVAAATGTTRIDSSLPPCSARAVTCPAGQRWTVTIHVQ
jgi:hypothetical protein